MECHMKENIKMDKKMEEVDIHGVMEVHMMGISKAIIYMGLAVINGQMIDFMKESGKLI